MSKKNNSAQTNLEIWKEKNSSMAGYSHFDDKISINKAWKYITNTDKVARHAFYPMIQRVERHYKISKNASTLTTNLKMREIYTASHFDRCIYKYYNYNLNKKYNDYLEKEDINDCSVAHRSELELNNILISKKAFDFINKIGNCVIWQGDFKGFYDNLNHSYLTQRLCQVLNISKLSSDWQSVLNSVTNYSFLELLDILKIRNLVNQDIKADIRKAHDLAINNNFTQTARHITQKLENKRLLLNGVRPLKAYTFKDRITMRALSKDDFKTNKKKYIKTNKKGYGIPQGVSISSTLSNVYMIEFDKKLNKHIKQQNGLYLRYSDDFIIILPAKNQKTLNSTNSILQNNTTFLHDLINSINGLILEKNKTQFYLIENGKVTNVTDSNNSFRSKINYLGFTFDGKVVTIRGRTIFKYYTRMYKKLKTIEKCKGITRFGHKVNYKEIYSKYTNQKKNNKSKYGNFLNYVNRSAIIFGSNSTEIKRHTKNHQAKLRRRINKI